IAFDGGHGGEQTATGGSDIGSSTLLATANYAGGDLDYLELRMVALWQVKLVKPGPVNSPSDSKSADLAFALVESATDKPDEGRIAWIAYGQSKQLARKPVPTYSWDIVCGLGGEFCYIVGARSAGTK